ncbi:ABC transporter ATP-binding protein [Desulfosporosinus youngiae]|uniref:ABC-type cobalamin/Fe3+-siderophore transport system, ATPase component n=1 Tax=Desulfosporosinus youngiae DSM 17734 TaxID=768710 RepID=H5XX98_9FIRM|nr:ABC transporter ATP-binding protein [Desulfosporosinus youngiae]EHQ91038.1 ABC-type cobalamin/Fe3+-siderophore transport system, ATPase component [Desulfosporosinus youngiae DSM 17734]
MELKVTGVACKIQEITIVQDVSLEVKKGEFVGLIGPNGSGKTTLLKNIYRVYSPSKGVISLMGEDISRQPFKKTFQKMSVVAQETTHDFDFTVREVVMMGRTPHKTMLEQDTEEDEKIISESLAEVGILELMDRHYATLSGGEKQRVQVARALAQKAQLLIMDEPTNHLDIAYKLQIMKMVRDLGITVFTTLHDLNIAALYCDRLYVINEGRIVCEGTPEAVLCPEILARVFGVAAEVAIHPLTKKPNITFLP